MWPWRLAIICLCMEIGSTVVPVNTPFQIVRPTPNHTSMVAVTDGLAMLAQHEGNIALVSVVGPYHSGKSFLLNSLLHHTQTFNIGRKTSPETMGIWLCRTNMTARDGSEIWLMDSEGFFGPGVDEDYDAKVFTVASLVGAHIVYNTVKIIDQQAISLLEMLVQRAQLFRTRTVTKAGEVPDFLRMESLPPLTWVVEDFVQELPSRVRDEGATGWLRTYVESSMAETSHDESAGHKSKHKSDFLTRLYHDVRVHTLFLPATKREQLQDLSRLSWHELTPEYRNEVDDLRAHIFRNLQARHSGGTAMTGPAVAGALQFIVRGLQQGMFHQLPSIWGTWTSQVAAVSLDDTEVWFASLLEKVDNFQDPIPISVFNDRLEQAREMAFNFYRTLLRNFEIQTQQAELKKRMEACLTRAIPAYHERIRRWVSEQIALKKDGFHNFLASQVLPMDPASLERSGVSIMDTINRNFSAQINTFSASSKHPVQLGMAVQMPPMSPDPIAQLASDLRAQLGTRSLENERAVQQLFKQAAAAADDAARRELEANSGMLMSKARLKEVRNILEQRCWQIFEDHLAAHAWSKSVSHYKANRALVQAESYEARLSVFGTANEARLKAHFQGIYERSLASYYTNKSSIGLPAPEAEVEAQHSQLVLWTQEMLQGPVKDLIDTDAFNDAKKKLDSAMVDGLHQIREKNIELWKAHSDEATRCAIAANIAAEQACGAFGLFNTIPWVHQAKSRRHLSDCFAQSSIGSRMSKPLRAHVFDAWYHKDMGRDVQRVKSRFNMLLVTAMAIVAGIMWMCCCRGRRPNQAVWQRQQPQYFRGAQNYGNFGPPPGANCYGQGGRAQPPWGSFNMLKAGGA